MAKESLPFTDSAIALNSLMAFSSLGFTRRISVTALRDMNSFVSGPLSSVHMVGVDFLIARDAMLGCE